jgi:hypothetical protein
VARSETAVDICTIPFSFARSFIWFSSFSFVVLQVLLFSHNCIDAVIVRHQVSDFIAYSGDGMYFHV